MTIEQGNNPSFRFGSDNMDVIERWDLEENTPSSVINQGIDRIDDVKRLKRKVEDLKSGRINVFELVDFIEQI